MHLITDNLEKRNPKSRSSFLCCLILILVVLLTACAGSGAGTGSSAGSAKAETDNNAAKPGQGSSAAAAAESDGSAAEPESDGSAEPLRIGVLKIADSFPLYAAVEEGLFEKRGLQVEIIEFQSASDQSVAYEAGELDGMMTDMIVQSLINKAAGEDGMRAVAMALGGSPEEGRFLVVSSPSAGIDSPEDLVGKRIGISENTMMEYLVTRYLEDLGIDPGQTQMVNIPKLTLRLDAVMEGKDIQAAILPDPLAIEAVERGCGTVIDDTKLGKNYSQSVFTLRRSILQETPERARAFREACDEAITLINEDPARFADLFVEKANVAPDLQDAYTVPSYTPSCVPTEEEVDSIQRWMVEKGLLEKAFSYEEIVEQP